MVNSECGVMLQDDLQKDFVLRLSSLFEGDFSIDWLVEITELKASTIISILEEQALHGPIRNVKPAVYAFELDSRQEWMAQLGSVEKERLHRNIASILIREMPDDDNKALLVSKHLIGLKNNWQDCIWLLRAGEIYTKKLFSDQSITCFRHVIETLNTQSGANEDRLFVQAAIGYSNCYMGESDPQHFIKILKEARQRAGRLKNRSKLLPLIEMHIAKHERLCSQFDAAFRRFKKAFAAAIALDDPDLVAEATVFQIYFSFWQGLFNDVIEIYEHSVPDVHRSPSGSFPTLAAMLVGHCYTIVGQVTTGLGMLDALHGFCLENGDRYLAAYASSTIAMVMLSGNRIDDALSYLKVALKEADESNNLRIKTLAVLLLALVFAIKKNTKEFTKFFNRFSKIGHDLHSHLHLNTYLLEVLWHAHQFEVDFHSYWDLEKEIQRVYGLSNIFTKGMALRYRALIDHKKGMSHSHLVEVFKKSIQYIEKSGHKNELVKTHVALARYYLSIDRKPQAKTLLKKISGMDVPVHEDLVPDDLLPLLGKEQNENGWLKELLGLTAKLTGKTNQSKVLQQIITTANRMTGAERGALLLIGDVSDGHSFKLRASKNITMEQIDSPAFETSRRMIEKVIGTSKGAIYEAGVPEDGMVFCGEIIRSGIAVPVYHDDVVTGVLYHDNRLLGNIFKPADLELLSFFAMLIAMELDREQAHLQLAQYQRMQEQVSVNLPSEAADSGNPEGILGKSPAFLKTLAKVRSVAASDSAVLITGETGVGKNLLARAIHDKSPRRSKPFITVQCSSLAESLITSELFGHEKGAFTGAVSRSIGRFEMADGGTLFLDEIGDLSLDIQGRLLRVLQTKEFERVGGGRHILTSDFRLIAATNKQLDMQVAAGRFRQDLYYRINVFPIEVPPLRERREDIPLLVRHFLDRYATRENKSCRSVAEHVMDKLMRHLWPGNIRELKNVIQRGVLSSYGAVFQLPSFEKNNQSQPSVSAVETFEENARRHIIEALRLSHGKLYGPGGAADILQINSSTLASRMKKLGIRKGQWG